MSQLIGTFVKGDSGTPFTYVHTRDGAVVDVSEATSIVLNCVRLTNGVDVNAVPPGNLLTDGSDGTFAFGAIGASSFLPTPASRLKPDVYECRISYVIAGLIYWTDAFRIAIVKFP